MENAEQTGIEITEQEQADAALQESEKRFEDLAEMLPEAIFETDLNLNLIYANQKAFQIFEYSREDFDQGLHAFEMLVPEDREKAQANAVRRMQGEASSTVEYRALRKSGSTFPMLLRVDPIIKDGDAIGFRGVIIDITERKNLELKLKQRENMLRRILDTTPASIFVKDRDGMYLVVNKGMADQHGTTPEDIVGKYDYEIAAKWFETVDYEEFRQAEQDVIDNKKTLLMEGPFVFQDGTERWYQTTKIPFELEDRKNCLMTISIDITERKKAEEDVRKHRDHLEEMVASRTSELEKINQELEAFSYSVSHDLRAPLRAMDGFSLALLEDFDETLDDDGRYYLNRIRSASQRMGQLIDDLLMLSRLNRADMRIETVDLSELVRSIAQTLQQGQLERQVEFTIQENVMGQGDRRLLTIALDNLLANAWKFTADQPLAMIEFGMTERDGACVYYVRDNGVGFDMAHAGRLFTPFQRLHAEKEFPGIGVGLSVVKRIVNRHGGRVWVESVKDQGATFYFSLATGVTCEN